MIVLKSLARAWIKRLTFAPSGTAIAAAAGGSGLLLWSELLNGKRAEVLKIPVRIVDHLAYTADGARLFCAGIGATNEPRSMRTGLCAVRLATREVAPFPERDGRALGFALAPDSAHVIMCEERYESGKVITRNTCRLLRAPGGSKWEFENERFFSFGPFFVNADQYLVVSTREGTGLHLWTHSAATGELVSEVSGVAPPPGRVILSPDATRIAAVSGMFVHVQPVNGPFSEKPVARNDNKKHFIDLAYHPSGRYLATVSNDETVKFFDTTTWQIVRTFTWNTGKMRAVGFSPDGTLAAAGGEKGQVVVWDVDL